MRLAKNRFLLLLAVAATILAGCHSGPEPQFDCAEDYFEAVAVKTEYPELCCDNPRHDLLSTPRPDTVRTDDPKEYWALTLQEAIQIALSQSEVIRDAGGRLIQAPNSSQTVYDIAIRESDPFSGPEAALSAFDARWESGMFWERNEPLFNNILFGGGSNTFSQDLARFDAKVTKYAAGGQQFAVRNQTNYNFNQAVFNQFDAVYDTLFEAEAIQPLGQGGGIEFNRIAGPGNVPGQYRGVLIGRINTDIQVTDFEIAVRDLLYDVEQTYWNLYFAYRDLDAKILGRDSALETWRLVQRKVQVGTADDEQEARAREQYFLFQAQVIDAMSGATVGTQVIASVGGVYTNEKRLRALLGLPATDGRLIRPADEPIMVDTVISWEDSISDALYRRPELRKQKWVVKRRELELIASNNYLMSRFDLVGRYRWRGLGQDLLGSGGTPQGSAFGDLINRTREEWTLGMQWSTPIGNRIGHNAVTNAEWYLARERALLREQELQISNELSRTFIELDRANEAARANYNRAVAARQQLEQVRKKYAAGTFPLDNLLDAERRASVADSQYYRTLVEYSIAISSVYRSRGTLLDYYDVRLAEGPWTPEAYRSAAKEARKFPIAKMNYKLRVPCDVSKGPVSNSAPSATLAPETLPPGAPAPPNQNIPGQPGEPELLPPQAKHHTRGYATQVSATSEVAPPAPRVQLLPLVE